MLEIVIAGVRYPLRRPPPSTAFRLLTAESDVRRAPHPDRTADVHFVRFAGLDACWVGEPPWSRSTDMRATGAAVFDWLVMQGLTLEDAIACGRTALDVLDSAVPTQSRIEAAAHPSGAPTS